jgi:hypothetical protein
MTGEISRGGKAMTITQRRLLTFGPAIVAVVSLVGGADAASTIAAEGTVLLAQSQQLYDYNYNNPGTFGIRPGCYMPSDGCLSEYSVQNLTQ